MNIGERIKELRIRFKYTQEELAEAAKTTKQTIHKYETGIITNIPASKIKALADKLNTTPAYLMGWENNYIKEADNKSVKYTAHEQKVITQYRAKPEMQPAVDTLLGVEPEPVPHSVHLSNTPFIAAQSGKKMKAPKPTVNTLIDIELNKKK